MCVLKSIGAIYEKIRNFSVCFVLFFYQLYIFHLILDDLFINKCEFIDIYFRFHTYMLKNK